MKKSGLIFLIILISLATAVFFIFKNNMPGDKPQNSPVSPEKFKGYHTGSDFEIFPEELGVDVSVKAVCAGKLLLKEYATGYGGVAVQSCALDNNPITVIYGHLKLT